MGHVDVSRAFWHDRSVLVTGAAGLLGGWVSRKLADAGARVIGLDIEWAHGTVLDDRDAAARIDGDVRDRRTMDRLLQAEGADTVVHLAAQALVVPANDDSRADLRAQHPRHLGNA